MGAPYGVTAAARGGTEPYSYAVTAGELPPGMELHEDGTISGVSTVPGLYRFTLQAWDTNNCTVRRNYTIAVQAPDCDQIEILPERLPVATVGVPYDATFSVSGDSQPYVWLRPDGRLPPGVFFYNTGELHGTPTEKGTYKFTVQATGVWHACTTHRSYSITVEHCRFCDDFEDAVLGQSWRLTRPESWSEPHRSLVGVSDFKARALALFVGCERCAVEASMQTTGGAGGRVWLLGWYSGRGNYVELIMNEASDTWTFRQHAGGAVVSSRQITRPIEPGVEYRVRLAYDGVSFLVHVDGDWVLTVPATGTPSGIAGFQVKGTTASFGEIRVTD